MERTSQMDLGTEIHCYPFRVSKTIAGYSCQVYERETCDITFLDKQESEKSIKRVNGGWK